MNLSIRPLTAEETYPLRNQILRPGQDLEACKYPGDHAPDTFHVGAIEDDELISVMSIYKENHPDLAPGQGWRMRGVATRADKRRRGLAMLLLNHVEFHLFERNADYLWANARVEALPFYEDACFDIVSQEFDIPGIGPHRLVVIRYDEDDDDFLDE